MQHPARTTDAATTHLLPTLVLLLAGFMGSYLLFASLAAAPTANNEAETGTVSPAATKVTDSTASNGQAVMFASASGGPAVLDASTPGPDAVTNSVPTTTSPAFSPPAKSILYAAFSMDSASYATSSPTVVSSMANTGSGLTWHSLCGDSAHSSTAGGFTQLFWAYNPTAQTNITATATFSQNTKNVTPPVGDMQILVFTHAASNQAAATCVVNNLLTSKNNAPFVTITTSKANSLVYTAFNNWDNSQTPVPASGQSIQSIVLNQADRDGYWMQRRDAPVVTAGTAVTMSATDPGNSNEWRALAWEVLN